MTTEEKYVDWKGTPIVVGSVVIADTNPDTATDPPGKVVAITEPDYDYDDDLGRGVQYGPYISVQWPEHEDGDVERFKGFNPDWQDPYLHQFDDVSVVV